jgi:hypothetical protein
MWRRIGMICSKMKLLDLDFDLEVKWRGYDVCGDGARAL